LPATVRKAIYLDSDVIVMADIEELWNQEIESYDMLAVQDAFIPYFSSPKGFQNYQQLGFPADRKYFNAGVLVLNLDRWRSSDLTSKILHFVTTHADRISWHDQDGLNAIVQNIGELDPRWNQQIRMYGESFSQQMDRKSYEEVIANPYIIHYLSKDKPWKWKCTHPKRNLFFHYLKLTAWADWRLPWWQVGLQVIRQISHYVRQGRWDVRQWFK
ncbi:MAG: glycosyltransferase, partial [Leptolyngbyaceae cyanobacterium bins.59]|nr:glycosyltransferase [Leptolyngbyaceae cyanobacterium bins.59]